MRVQPGKRGQLVVQVIGFQEAHHRGRLISRLLALAHKFQGRRDRGQVESIGRTARPFGALS